MNVNQLLLNKRKANAKRHPVYRAARGATLMGPPLVPAPISRKKISTPSQRTKNTNNLSTIRSSVNTSSSFQDSEIRKCVVALTEGRGQARCEVGIASMELSNPCLVLCQISDTHNYINTITKINILNPTEIIVPATFLEGWNNRLVEAIRKQFPNVKLMGTPRKTFSNANGMERIGELCLPSINTICMGLQYRSYAVSAASALLTYLQNSLAIYHNSESVNVVYQEAEGFAIVDVSTADQLELVSCAKPAQASRYSTLFGVLNRCYTKLGTRALRSAILQPPCHVPYIEERLNCVAELMKYPEKLFSIQAVLQKLKNVDQLLSITSLPASLTDDNSNNKLNYLLLLSSVLDLISPLKDSLDGYKSQFLVEFQRSLESENFNNIKELLAKTIHSSARFAKGENGIYQRCFAIKPEINGLLDVVRKIYSERLEDMRAYVNHLGIKHNLPLTLNNTTSKGYHMVMKLNSQQKRSMGKIDLPLQFIQVYRLPGSFTFKTMELIDYSTRLQDILDEVLKISNLMIQDLLAELKKYIGFFFKLCEDIARLDMLQSLANVSKDNQFTRPKFGDFTEVKDAQHPMLAFLCNDPFIENPISASKDFNVTIITGPNGAGKSIYIRQIILLQVMAQVGCYIPATSAMFRPADRMFARVYLEDDLSCGASAFTLEMREICYMLSVMTDNSLYIIDELCRSTSLEEGTALAMAICERFCHTSAYVYFATHYTLIAKLRDMYFNVKTFQMETVAAGDLRNLSLKFKYKLTPGVTQLKRYGIYLVKSVWTESTMEIVYEILEQLEPDRRQARCVPIDDKIRMKYELDSKLRLKKDSITRDEFNELINDYKNRLRTLGMDVDITLRSVSASNNRSESGSNNREEPEEIQRIDYNLNLVQNVESPGSVVSNSPSQRLFRRSIDESSEMAAKLVPQVQFDESIYLSTQSVDNSSALIMEDDDNLESEMMSLMDEMEACGVINNSAASWDNQSFSSIPKADESSVWLSETHRTNEEADFCAFPNVIIQDGPNGESISSQSQSHDEHISVSYSPSPSPTRQMAEFEDGATLKLDSGTAVTSKSPSKSLKAISEYGNLQDVSGTYKITTDDTCSMKRLERKFVIREHSSSRDSSVIAKRPPIKKRSKFVPPKKLTKREIREDFSKQDQKMYEEGRASEDYSSLLNRIRSRPSVRQLQNAQHLVMGRKTPSGGVEVIPLDQGPSKKKLKTDLHRSASFTTFDVSIFSDKNAKPFDEFINSSKRKVDFFNFQPYSNSTKINNVFQSTSSANVGIFEDDKEVSFNLNLSQHNIFNNNQSSSRLDRSNSNFLDVYGSSSQSSAFSLMQ